MKVRRFYFEWAEPVPEAFQAAARQVLGAESHVTPPAPLIDKLMVAAAVHEDVFARLGLEQPEQELTLLVFAITTHPLGAWLYVPHETAANDTYPETAKALAEQIAEHLGGRQTQASWRARKATAPRRVTHVVIGRDAKGEIVETAPLTQSEFVNDEHWLLDFDALVSRGVVERELQYFDDAGQLFQTQRSRLAPDRESWMESTMTRTKPPPPVEP